jgi:hypothetical protein
MLTQRWLWLQRYIAGQNWATKIRDITHNAPWIPRAPRVSVFLTSPGAPRCAGGGPYKPEALREHDDFKHSYPQSQGTPQAPSTA